MSRQLSLSVVFKNQRKTLAHNKQLASSILSLCRQSTLQGLELCLAPLFPPPWRAVGSRHSASYWRAVPTSAWQLFQDGTPRSCSEILWGLPLGSLFANAGLHPFKLGALRVASQNTPHRPLVRGSFQHSREGLLTWRYPLASGLSHSASGQKTREDSVSGSATGEVPAAWGRCYLVFPVEDGFSCYFSSA